MAKGRMSTFSRDGSAGLIDAEYPLPVAAPGGPLNYLCNTVAASGVTQLLAAPGAGQRIVVVAFHLQNESQTGTTIILRDGGSNRWRFLGQNQGDGLAMVFAPGSEWRLSANAALNIVLSGANQCGYSIAYHVERAI